MSAVSARAILATADPVFAALCRRALEAAHQPLLASVAPSELLETARQLGPELIVLDADGEDIAAVKLLASKVMLVSDARIVVVSGYLAPGSPGLSGLLQTVAATFAQKPQGPTSLGLAADDGDAFVTALRVAFAAHDAEDLDGKALGTVVAPALVAARPRPVDILPHDVDIDDAWDTSDVEPDPDTYTDTGDDTAVDVKPAPPPPRTRS